MTNSQRFLILVLAVSATLLIQSCSKTSNQSQTATEIISNYYKTKNIDKAVVLDEKHRIILDTIVLRLTETGEPEVVIQYIVNDYKLKHGIK